MACGLPINSPDHSAFGCPAVLQTWAHVVWRRIRFKSGTRKRKAHRLRQDYSDRTENDTIESTDMVADTEIDGADEDLFKQLSPDDAYLSCKY